MKQIFEDLDHLVLGDPVRCRDGSLAYDTRLASALSGLECKDESLTVQSDESAANLNNIAKAYGLETVPELPADAVFVDQFSEIYDFQTAMNTIVQARESFDRLPAPVRARFRNDPHEFVQFCSDEKNLDEMRKLGLAKVPDSVVSSSSVVESGGVSDGKEKVK